jgi:hypothetical protein
MTDSQAYLDAWSKQLHCPTDVTPTADFKSLSSFRPLPVQSGGQIEEGYKSEQTDSAPPPKMKTAKIAKGRRFR